MTDEQATLIITELRAIRDEIRLLREPETKRLKHVDTAALSELLPLIFGALSLTPFTVKRLYSSARADLRLALAKTTSKKLGQLLGRGCDFEISGYRIEQLIDTRDGWSWRVVRDDDKSQKVAPLAIPRLVRFNDVGNF